MSRLALALAAALPLVASCAKDARGLVPFPCAEDGTCPSGLSCMPGVGCVVPSQDAPCDRGTQCTIAGKGYGCGLGTCTVPCRDGVCDPGRVCVHQDGEPWCLLDCTAAACPDGLVCRDTYVGGGKVCVGAAVSFPACVRVAIASECQAVPVPAFQCGASYFTVACGNGRFCTVNSTCSTDGQHCTCNDGYLGYSCTGTSCRDTTCTYPDWGCAPLPGASCADVPSQFQGTCQCASGLTLDFVCGEGVSCEQRCRDVLAPQRDGGADAPAAQDGPRDGAADGHSTPPAQPM
jgi:hypothetical protein